MDAKMAKAQSEKVSKEQRRHMRLRFKRLIRLVMSNMDWLEDTEQDIVMNAKKNVAFLIRQRRKTGILTVAERALLRTPHEKRTIEDRKKLCKIVASLPCFAMLPPKLRVRLIPYLTIRTIGEGHKLIRQDDPPIMVYFVISGEVEMMKSVYDKNTKKVVVNSEAILSVGDIIGDVEILEDCWRLNSYTTRSPCEILNIMDDEFHLVIGKFMSNLWMQKKMALKSLSYFNFFTNEQLVRACSYCQLVKYDPLDSIYSEDKGAVSCVHFVLSGECLILQCLAVETSFKPDGTKTYTLEKVNEADPADTNMPTGLNLQASEFNVDELVASSSDSSDSKRPRRKKRGPKIRLRDIELACGLDGLLPRRKKMHSTSKRRLTEISRYPSTIRHPVDEVDGDDVGEIFEEMENEYTYYYEGESCESSLENVTSYRRPSRASIQQTWGSRRSSVRRSLGSLSRYKTWSSSDDSSSSTYASPIKMPETRFMDVGSLMNGAIFGLGEKIVHRIIMARTVVQCLLLPRYWLMQEDQNPGNIWLRFKYFLEESIPSREEVFEMCLQTRHWEKWRSDYVQSTLNTDRLNGTHPEDIPIFSRILETRDEN